jgi:hypothetical protein
MIRSPDDPIARMLCRLHQTNQQSSRGAMLP